MGLQRALRRKARLEVERHGIGDQAAVARGDQQSERVGADKIVLRTEIVFAMVGRLIHDSGPFAVAILRRFMARGFGCCSRAI